MKEGGRVTGLLTKVAQISLVSKNKEYQIFSLKLKKNKNCGDLFKPVETLPMRLCRLNHG